MTSRWRFFIAMLLRSVSRSSGAGQRPRCLRHPASASIATRTRFAWSTDATRLNAAAVTKLVREAGLEIAEEPPLTACAANHSVRLMAASLEPWVSGRFIDQASPKLVPGLARIERLTTNQGEFEFLRGAPFNINKVNNLVAILESLVRWPFNLVAVFSGCWIRQ